MIRKTLYGLGGAAALGLLVFGWDAASYVTTSVDYMKDSVKQNVPVQFEIERLRTMVTDIEPDIKKNMHTIAEEEVKIRLINERVTKLEEQLEGQKVAILRMKSDLGSNREVFTYASHEYTKGQVEKDLASKFNRFKTKTSTLDNLKQVHSARVQSLAAAKDKLDGMRVAKQQLAVEIENLEAQQKLVDVAKTTSQYSFDDSSLGRARELANELRIRIEVDREHLAADSYEFGEIQVTEEIATEGILDQVTEYFEETPESEIKIDVETIAIND